MHRDAERSADHARRRRSHLRLLSMMAAAALAMMVPSATHAEGGGSGLLDALAHVPATPETFEAPISYADYHELAAARPGALEPGSLEEVLTLYAAGDPSAEGWIEAFMGLASGPSDLSVGLMSQGVTWPESMGFDFVDIERAVSFGTPPAQGTVLLGAFDSEAVEAAHAARGYTSSALGDHALLCGPAGCDAGLDVDFTRLDPRVPFGGRLGRQEPVAVSDRSVSSSPDLATLERILAAADGTLPSLADLPAVEAIAQTLDDDVHVIQATFLPTSLITALAEPMSLLKPTLAEAEANIAELDGLTPLPPAQAVAVVDGATPTEQVLSIALAYADEDVAAAAAESLAERLASVRSTTRDVPLAELLAERGVSQTTVSARRPSSEGLAVALLELRAPLAGVASTGSAGSAGPSALYRLFMDLVYSHDLSWITPSAGPGG